MVIQRSWKIHSENNNAVYLAKATSNLLASTSSSEDSDGSNQTSNSVATSNTNTSSPRMDVTQNIASVKTNRLLHKPSQVMEQNAPFQKFISTPQMAESVLFRLKQRFGWQITGPNSSSEAVMRSLELLRINVQKAFDKEVDIVISKFMETYFKPAFKNIKENMGDHIVSEDVLQKMTCALLENSKAQYTAHRSKQQSMTFPNQPLALENGPQTRMTLKRPQQQVTSLGDSAKRSCIASAPAQEVDSASNVKVDPPAPAATSEEQNRTPTQKVQSTSHLRRQIFWNTANISTETNFVLDVQANHAFGFGTDGKERLASKHPELIRYLPDAQDRDWLVEQNIIPSQNCNSRFLFLIYDEVLKLYQTSELYKNQININLSILHMFKIPNFMIQKMKLFFVDLNIKSRGLIANSYSANTNSHLRNALLQGSQAGTAINSASCTSSTGSSNNMINGVSTSTDAAASSKAVTQSSPKTKTSSLSSSHATLTALLTNTTSGGSTSGSTSLSSATTNDSLHSSQ